MRRMPSRSSAAAGVEPATLPPARRSSPRERLIGFRPDAAASTPRVAFRMHTQVLNRMHTARSFLYRQGRSLLCQKLADLRGKILAPRTTSIKIVQNCPERRSEQTGANSLTGLAPQAGFEPATLRLTGSCRLCILLVLRAFSSDEIPLFTWCSGTDCSLIVHAGDSDASPAETVPCPLFLLGCTSCAVRYCSRLNHSPFKRMRRHHAHSTIKFSQIGDVAYGSAHLCHHECNDRSDDT